MSLLDTASLLLTPNAYKEGKLYSVIPSDGSGDFTFTRATTATRVNSDGLVELVPYNLLTYSEQFNNAAWVKSGLNTSGSYIDVAIAPNGTLTADLMAEDTANSQHNVRLSATMVGSQSHTYSFYAKPSGRINIQVGRFNSSVVPSFTHSFTIDGGGSSLGGNIENVGNGWYRCSGTFTTVGIGVGGFIIYLSDGASISYTGNGTSGIYLWGAQLVEGTNALPYQKTETRLNIPRIDSSLGGCPNILLEPQRTNLALQSSSFDSASWAKTNSTVTANAATSPSGVQDADLYTTSSTSEYVQQTLSLTSGTTYTFSLFVKYVDEPIAALVLTATAFSPALGCNYDLINETVTPTTPSTTGTIQAYDNGWYRISITGTATGTGSGVLRFASPTTTPVVNFYLWGAQLEAGAYATSYIQTTTASVTRNAEVLTRNNIYTNGLISASGGTWFIELKNNTAYTSDSNVGAIFLDTASFGYTNGLLIRKFIGNRIRLYSYTSTVGSSLYQTITDNVKIAVKWNGTTADVFVNGVKEVSSAPFTITNMQFLSNNTTPFMAYISSMLLAPTPLTDDECIQLTTL